MSVVVGVLWGILGLIVGSFANVCIYRLPRHIFWKEAHSYCPCCGHRLPWYDMIPVISWLCLKGRCRYCHERISARYPVVEAAAAVLWTVCYLVYGMGWYTAWLSVLGTMLLVVAGIDLDSMEIPNGLVVAIAIWGLAPFIASFFDPNYMPDSLPWWGYPVGIVSASVPMLLLALLTRGGVGGGDIKLLAAVGLGLGWRLCLLGTLAGAVLGGLAAVVLIVVFGKNKRAMIPFAPALCAGLMIAAWWGNDLIAAVSAWL